MGRQWAMSNEPTIGDGPMMGDEPTMGECRPGLRECRPGLRECRPGLGQAQPLPYTDRTSLRSSNHGPCVGIRTSEAMSCPYMVGVSLADTLAAHILAYGAHTTHGSPWRISWSNEIQRIGKMKK